VDERIKNTLDYIEDNLATSHSLESISKVACLSPSQFHRLFKKETRKTPFQFIETLRLNKAYQLLIQNENAETVAGLASRLGYNDYETLSRAFKKVFNISPDDVKSIVGKVRATLSESQDSTIHVAAINSDDPAKLLSTLKKIMSQQNISSKDLLQSKIFKVVPKSSSTKAGTIIKNKYVMAPDKRIWNLLIAE
jgi:AraC-like DNA-binding protein